MSVRSSSLWSRPFIIGALTPYQNFKANISASRLSRGRDGEEKEKENVLVWKKMGLLHRALSGGGRSENY